MDQLIFVLEMIGTIAFAVSGVIAAKEKEMDLFGAIVLGCTTAVGGGMVRDLILGKTPPLIFIVLPGEKAWKNQCGEPDDSVVYCR